MSANAVIAGQTLASEADLAGPSNPSISAPDTVMTPVEDPAAVTQPRSLHTIPVLSTLGDSSQRLAQLRNQCTSLTLELHAAREAGTLRAADLLQLHSKQDELLGLLTLATMQLDHNADLMARSVQPSLDLLAATVDVLKGADNRRAQALLLVTAKLADQQKDLTQLAERVAAGPDSLGGTNHLYRASSGVPVGTPQPDGSRGNRT